MHRALLILLAGLLLATTAIARADDLSGAYVVPELGMVVTLSACGNGRGGYCGQVSGWTEMWLGEALQADLCGQHVLEPAPALATGPIEIPELAAPTLSRHHVALGPLQPDYRRVALEAVVIEGRPAILVTPVQAADPSIIMRRRILPPQHYWLSAQAMEMACPERPVG